MPEVEYLAPLDTDEQDWIRVQLRTVSGVVKTFVVQCELILTGKHMAVVRYDNHHGFCHRDRLNRRGEVIEKLSMIGTPAEVATAGAADINANWKRYRAQFLGNET